MGIRPLREGIPISQEYGTNPGGYNPAGGHTGRDYAAFRGEKLVAIAEGRVWFADHSYNLPGGPQGWAQRLFLDLTFGGVLVVIEYDDVYAIYAHLSRTDLNAGDWVRQGDLIGLSGNTGGASSGDHLHFEILPRYPNYASPTYGRVHPAPYITGPYRLNGAKTPPPVMGGTDWLPGAVRSPQPGAVKLDTSLPRRATWHITSDVDPGKTQPAFSGVSSYLKNAGYCPHLMWDPFTGHIEQYYPANVGARALKAWNEDGARHIQIEVLFSRGAVRDGKQYWELAETPLRGFTQIVQWLDSHGIPRVWPMGPTPPIGTTGRRDVGVWNGKAGHYGHSQVPDNDHTDPGRFPDITRIPAATGAAAGTSAGDDLLEGLLTMDQKTFEKQRKIAGTPAWYLANGRDHSAGLTTAVKTLTGLVKGIPASVLQAKVTRKGAGAGSAVTQADALAYEKDNWARDRDAQQTIIEQNAQIIALLTEQKGA
ncbi:M23 family metallopeptidase [Kocuria rhizophila]|uniref:M23 family metallopeptidase n=1 Tax=Kocuria rhizophila TaxID=72000 RepID=UPI001EF68B45|nr:M23 family metallopeptidase [Kocuria rhizophila]